MHEKAVNRVVDLVIRALGTPTALVLATLAILLWAITGPIFGFSDTWQLAINTGTTIVTFLMVFVIQNAQNRDAKSVHVKLNELITSMEGARNRVVLAEALADSEQDREIEHLARLAERMGETEAAVEALSEAAEQSASGIKRPYAGRVSAGKPVVSKSN